MYPENNTLLAVTTDIVLFTIQESTLKVLLIFGKSEAMKGKWALPGGFVQPDEDLDQAARRELSEKTGISGVYLEQLYTFGTIDRDPRGRTISVAYYALIPADNIVLRAPTGTETIKWVALNKIPELAFDHKTIVASAHQRLVAKLNYSTIGFQFLPAQFSLSELQQVYAIILREQIDKRNFRKRVLASPHIEETDQERRHGAHRPAKLYRVKDRTKIEYIK